MGPWGLSHSHWLWWPRSAPHSRAHWLPVLTQVTPVGTSHQALSQKLLPALTLQSPLFVCLAKTKLYPNQPFSMPIKCCSAPCWTLQTSQSHKAGTNPSSPSWSKCSTHQRRPQIVKNDPNLIQGHASGLIWGLFVFQCQCKAIANLVFPHRNTSWKKPCFQHME